MIENNIRVILAAAAGLAVTFTPLLAQAPIATDQSAVKPVIPSREDYPDAGQAFGMVWYYSNIDEKPFLAFQVPETDNQLWTMACHKQKDDSVRIANNIIATPPELVAEDYFGFTIRVDDGRSIGLLARMAPVNLEGEGYHMPRFYLPNSHVLFPALAQGNRAYVNLNGNKFSIHLKGSGDALVEFLKACQ